MKIQVQLAQALLAFTLLFTVIVHAAPPTDQLPPMKIQVQLAQALLACTLLFTAIVHADPSADQSPRAAVKLLTIGNSFADNSTRCLPQLSKAGGKKLLLCKANLGGHSFEQHTAYLEAFEANPDDLTGLPYQVNPCSETTGLGLSLREALESDTWDVVTIQQVSHLSPLYESYQPYANMLIAYIKKHAPQAEILIQETWAYPEDCPRYREPEFPYLQNPQVMYQNVKAAYEKLSAETGLKLIRVGDAFQTVLSCPDPIRLHEKDENGNGDIHANSTGEYLGAAMFYEAIYRESVLNVPCVPKGMSPENAKRLREVAHETAVRAVRVPKAAQK